MKKFPLILGIILSLLPLVSAEECGLLNLASCIPEKIYEYFIGVINSPIAPLLSFVKSLITEPVHTDLFMPLWAIMLYVLSLFYGFLIIYSGFNFIISGYNAARREKAKEWLRNTLIMIVLVQASYFLYSLVLDLNSLTTSGVMDLIDENFFKLTADNIVNIGLQFLFGLGYVVALFLSAIILTIRYLIVAAGVVIIPIAIFLYYIPPLQSYGRLILYFLGTCIFSTLMDAIIFLVSSKLLDLALFDNFKILVMISSFAIANLLMLYLMFFSILKAALNLADRVTGLIAMGAKYFI